MENENGSIDANEDHGFSMHDVRIDDDFSLSKTLDLLDQAILIARGDDIVYCNVPACDLLGRSREDLLAGLPLDMVHAEDRAMMSDFHARRLAGDSSLDNSYNVRLIRSDQSVVWVRLQVYPVQWHDAVGVMIFMDVIEPSTHSASVLPGGRVEPEASSGGSDFIGRFGKDGTVLDYSVPCGDELFDNVSIRSGEHIAGCGFPMDIVLILGRAIDEALSSGELQVADFSYVFGDTEYYYETRMHRVSPCEVFCVIRNVTGRKRNEQRLAAINDTMLHFGSEPSENIQEMTELAGRLLGARMCVLHTLCDGELELCSESNFPPDLDFPTEILPGPEGERRSLYVLEVTDENLILPQHYDRYGVESIVHSRVEFQGTFTGFLTLFFTGPFVPSDYDRETLTLVCASIAVEEERRRADEYLRESEDRFRETVDLLPEVVFETDRHGRVELMNQRGYRLFGKLGDLASGDVFLADFIKADQRERFQLFLNRVLFEDSTLFPEDFDMSCADGSVKPCMIRFSQIRNEGHVVGLRGVLIDLSERMAVENALRESRRRHRDLMHDMPIGLYETTGDGKLLHGNKALAKSLGYSSLEEMKNINVASLYVDHQIRESCVNELEARGVAEVKEFQLRRVDGSKGWFRDRAVRVSDGDSIFYRGFLEDISERKIAEEKLSQSEERMRLLVENARDLLVLFDSEVRISFCNTPPQFPIDPEEAVGKRPSELLDFSGVAAIEKRVRQVLDFGQPLSAETQFEIEGVSYWLGEEYSPVFNHSCEKITGVVMVVRNVTERRRAEAEREKITVRMQNMQRLESLANLAGGIAHNFNNLLQAIMGNAELAKMEAGADSTLTNYLKGIDDAAERAARLSEQMMGFSGQSMHSQEQHDVSQVLVDMEDLLSTTLSPHVRVEYSLDIGLKKVSINMRHLNQVMVNLLTNASEACEAEAGMVEVSTYQVDRLPQGCEGLSPEGLSPEGGTAGGWICIEVRDDGCGMDENTRRMMFDPFFSTKFTGRGLGMAAVHGIVRAHGGAIKVESRVGEGTSVQIYLPVRESSIESQTSQSAFPSESTRHSVMVVDDESVVLSVACRMLEGRGYSVRGASDGRECLDWLGREREQFDCVVLDMVMPATPGTDVFRKIRRHYPDLPIIVATGHDFGWVVENLGGQKPDGYVQKPYRAMNLFNEIDSVMLSEKSGQLEDGASA